MVLNLWILGAYYCWLAYILTCLSINGVSSSCQQQRTIFTNQTGIISDGKDNYPTGATCEWLIKAPYKNQSITLTFMEFATECSFDFLFIYDGGSYSSPLLASFSGKQTPNEIVSSSNELLIFLYSDKNYVLGGFNATYKISSCKNACSGAGACINGKCVCTVGRKGDYCEQKWCPDDCNSVQGKGVCNLALEKCSCNAGYYGASCSVSVHPYDGLNAWQVLDHGSINFPPRAGHVSCYYRETDTIWVHGGFSFKSVLSDLLTYNVNSSQWDKQVLTGSSPAGRYYHAGGCYKDSLVVFGGELSPNTLSDEFWIFNFNTLKWRRITDSGTEHPPALAGHSATVVDDYLFVIGGRTADDNYSTNMYQYNLKTESGWKIVVSRISNTYDLRVTGHSVVFHEDSRSLFIFGGLTPTSYRRQSRRTNRILVYRIDSNVWSILNPAQPDSHLLPASRAFHTANIIGDYMVVYGGLVGDDSCYSNQIHYYSFNCHYWVKSTAMELLSPVPNAKKAPTRGRYAHTAVVKNQDTLIFVGGFSGQFIGDVLSYKVSKAVVLKKASGFAAPGEHCRLYQEKNTCYDDPSCGWCFDDIQCYSHANASSCTKNWVGKYCPGPCQSHTQCESCVSRIGNAECTWCVQDAKCYPKNSPGGICSPIRGDDQRGWWGNNGTLLSDFDKCQSTDRRPGLTYMVYFHPEMAEYPDHVAILKEPKASVLSFSDGLHHSGSTVVIKGFLFPYLFNFDPSKAGRRVYLEGERMSATLYLSDSDAVSGKQLVATIPGSTLEDKEAARTDGRALFPTPAPSKSYYLECKGNWSSQASRGKLVLRWNLTTSSAVAREVIQTPYIQPFHSTDCTVYANCMACVTDDNCGWCSASLSCKARANWKSCVKGSVSVLLLRKESHCLRCTNHYDCRSCSKDKNCGWSSAMSRCLRRGLKDPVVDNPAMCAKSCRGRSNCQTCIADTECSWCEAKGACFPFSQYLDRFSFGQCSTWAEKDTLQHKCQNCSQHTKCSSCIADHKCGWCGDIGNPLIGRCISGDFSAPYSQSNCTAVVTGSTSASWSYSKCPDVDECKLGIDNCVGNSTCTNTHGSFTCKCNRGFTGDGVKECKKTCYHECVNGHCGSDYNCKCNLGWIGVNCTTDCGCNGHSSCTKGIGICDKCHNNTRGNFCEMCQLGSYRKKAPLTAACQLCQCNGHGDPSNGICDPSSGKCYCKDGTRGDHCEVCMEGLAGNPRNNGFCFHQCNSYSVIVNKTSGTISSASGSGVTSKGIHCKWLISAYDNTSHEILFNNAPKGASVIAVAVTFLHVHTSCYDSHIKIYDGIPPNPRGSGKVTNTIKQIGTICGFNASNTPGFIAKTGNLVIKYDGRQGPLPKGAFVAAYKVIRCPDSCLKNGRCKLNSDSKMECLCNDGWTGVNCDRETCPLNCSKATGQGQCSKDDAMCHCSGAWAGRACRYSLPHPNFSWAKIITKPKGTTPLPRYGHSVIYHPKDSDIFMFGGVTRNQRTLKDTWKLDLNTNTWTEIKASGQQGQSERYLHCSAIVKETLIVYGGILGTTQLNDVWSLHIASNTWTKLPLSNLPYLFGHTCTTVGDFIYVLGGYSMAHGLNELFAQIDITTMTWRYLKTNGFGPSGIYGHSSVYYAPDSIILTFGGMAFHTEKVQESNRLYSFHVPTKTWNFLDSTFGVKPPPLILHSMAILNDVLFIAGGYSSKDNTGLNTKIITLDLKCFQWGIFPVTGKEDDYEYHVYQGIGRNLVTVGNHIYSFDGSLASTFSPLWKLTVPPSFCGLMTSQFECLGKLGCTWCTYTLKGTSTVAGICFAKEGSKPEECTSAKSTNIKEKHSKTCNRSAIHSRSCSGSKSCVSCLATFPGASAPGCHWCQCRDGSFCAPKNTGCEPCKRIASISSCLEMKCEASSCENCGGSGECMWTRHFLYKKELLRIFSQAPEQPWNCFTASLEGHVTHAITDKSPPNPCPKRCVQFTDCKSCLSATGADGGTSFCVWSSTLSKCMSTTAIPVFCLTGSCGVVHTKTDSCPKPCSTYMTCVSCLETPGCGWCGENDKTGTGKCIEGGLLGSSTGICSVSSLDPGKPVVYTMGQNKMVNASSGISSLWASLLCPLENECKNGRHNCKTYEQCVDTPNRFTCECLGGYKKDPVTRKCRPICSQGCFHGTCVLPNQCKCDFGWTGTNCSVQCMCNGHSNCPNVSMANVCLKCENNTQGKYCQECKPLFVGDSKKGGTCTPCSKFCNNRATVCLNSTTYNLLPISMKDPDTIVKLLNKGSSDPARTVCVDCKGQSQGTKCETCKEGYFEHNGTCTMCRCNGHGSRCNAVTGEGCNCKHNTATDTTSCKSNCWMKQCTKCKDGYVGDPRNGRQCYKKLSTLETVVIGIESHPLGGTRSIKGIPSNRSLFFVTLPKFTNVDIRITVDIFDGAADLFISTSETSFEVDVNYNSGAEVLKATAQQRKKRSTDPEKKRSKRASGVESSLITSNVVIDRKDRRLSSFVEFKSGVLKISGIYKRTVVTVPYSSHDFRQVKFYCAVVTTGSKTSELTSGIVYSRQELSKIDLFVFFSVFFSIFFLILSTFVLIWKGKQAYSARVAARNHQIDVETMESRPFASYTMQIERNEPIDVYKARRQVLLNGGSKKGKQSVKSCTISPMAIEQTDDGLAAVVTVLVQFPENELSSWNLNLGSALATSTTQQVVNVTYSTQGTTGRKHNTRMMTTVT